MAFDYINEAFKRLDILDEELFDTSSEGINKLSDFIEQDDEVVRVIDPEAETDEELKDSYVGKVIVNCNVCHSHIFENKEDIVIEEEGVVNIEEQCPYCGEQEGFTIVGEIAPYNSSNEANDIEDSVDTSSEDSEEFSESLTHTSHNGSKYSRATRRTIAEDFKEVSITTDDQHMEMTSDETGKVTVTTEPLSTDTNDTDTQEEDTFDADAVELDLDTTSEGETEGETISPVSSETEEEIIDNNIENESEANEADVSEESTEEHSEESPEESSEESIEDVEIEEVDEESIDELGESYFKRVYENVESFKTSKVSANSTKLVVEGIIKFNSGKRSKTGFIFESRDINSKGKVRLVGSNKHISESTSAFSVVGSVNNKKLFFESLKYDYSANNTPVRGVVRRVGV